MKKSKLFFSLCAVSIFLFSCKEDKIASYPVEPHINLKKITIAKDSDLLDNHYVVVHLTLDYTDGDANLGRYQFDTSIDDYNCIITFYKKTNGNFSLIEKNNPVHVLIGEIPKLSHVTISMRNMVVKLRTPYEGEIQLPVYFYDIPYAVGDTLKVTLQVIDNDNNESNISEMEKVYTYE